MNKEYSSILNFNFCQLKNNMNMLKQFDNRKLIDIDRAQKAQNKQFEN